MSDYIEVGGINFAIDANTISGLVGDLLMAREDLKTLERERDELQAKCEALETAEFVEVADMATVLKSNAELLAALEDSISALDYISKMAEGNYTPGEILCGVGWDRIDKYRALLRGEEAT